MTINELLLWEELIFKTYLDKARAGLRSEGRWNLKILVGKSFADCPNFGFLFGSDNVMMIIMFHYINFVVWLDRYNSYLTSISIASIHLIKLAVKTFTFNKELIAFFLYYICNYKRSLNWFLKLWFIKSFRNFFTARKLCHIYQWLCIFNFFNHRYFFCPIWKTWSLWKYIFIPR